MTIDEVNQARKELKEMTSEMFYELKDKYDAFYEEHTYGVEAAKYIGMSFVRGFAIGTVAGLVSLAFPKVLFPVFLIAGMGLSYYDAQQQGEIFEAKMLGIELKKRNKGKDNVVPFPTNLH